MELNLAFKVYYQEAINYYRRENINFFGNIVFT